MTISLKLADFGLAMDVKEQIYTVCGTPTYVAPEILSEIGIVISGIARHLIMWKPPPKNGELRDIRPSYFTFQIVNNKGADQTALMRRLVCAFVVGKQQSQGFSYDVEAHASRPPPGYNPRWSKLQGYVHSLVDQLRVNHKGRSPQICMPFSYLAHSSHTLKVSFCDRSSSGLYILPSEKDNI